MCWKAPSIPQVGLTARDIVPQTDAPAPEAPQFGGSTDFLTAAQKKGKDALKITLEGSQGKADNNQIYF